MTLKIALLQLMANYVYSALTAEQVAPPFIRPDATR